MLTMPETMSIERRNLLKALGAEIVLTDGLTGMAGSIAKAQELRTSIPGSIILQQFENPSNAQIHTLTTGEEIWTDTECTIIRNFSQICLMHSLCLILPDRCRFQLWGEYDLCA